MPNELINASRARNDASSPPDLSDVIATGCLFVGVSCLTVACWMISPVVALVFVGGSLSAVGVRHLTRPDAPVSRGPKPPGPVSGTPNNNA